MSDGENVIDALLDRAAAREKTNKRQDFGSSENRQKVLEIVQNFDLTPQQIKEHLDKSVISQEDAKKVLSVGMSYHFRRTARFLRQELDGNENGNYIKKNILLIGPTGCGKTFSVEKVSQLVRVPFVKEDMTKFTASGYVGRDLEEVGIDLLSKANGDPDLARVGIVYLDEIDKIASRITFGKDVGGRDVQTGLLKMLEGSDIMIDLRTPLGVQRVELNTKYVLFVASGAFSNLLEYYQQSGQLTTQDLIKYGFEPEFIGRFPVGVIYSNLSENDYVAIMLDSEDSPLNQYRHDFEDWGIAVSFSEEAVRQVAKYANERGLGARGIVGVLERALLDYMFYLPGRYTGELQLTRELLFNPKLGLEKYLGADNGYRPIA